VKKPFFLAGNLADQYKAICSLEQKQAGVNPENKSVYAAIFQEIQGRCVQFNNELNAVKVHLPKAAAKSRANKRKSGDLTKPKEEAET